MVKLFSKILNSTTDGKVLFRIEKDQATSLVPMQVVEQVYPSDRRIKKDIKPVDEDSILQRLQHLEVKKIPIYRRVGNKFVVFEILKCVVFIAQQTDEVFPEYVRKSDQFTVGRDGAPFVLPGFHQVNKQMITLDLLAALHAQHRRFNIKTKYGSIKWVQ